MYFPRNLRYTKEHTWIKVEGEQGRVGITDFAQDQLKEVTFVELPEVGTEVKYMEPFGVIESVKAVSDLYSPVSGEVTEVNNAVEDDPRLVNQSPYDKGWMILVKMKHKGEIDTHMSSEDYKAYIKG